jgi:septal ring-binding cell division protein DamX
MIQLIGFFEPDQARAFTAANGIDESAWMRTSRYRGRNWHTVLIGDYPDRAAALGAIDALPPSLRELRPIARLLPVGTRLEPAN